MTMFLSGKFKKFGYLATKGTNKLNKITTNFELAKYMKNTPGAVYDLNKLVVYSTLRWDKIGAMIRKAGNVGKIDGYEFDDHPNTVEEQKTP
jgi:hypothetical protein